jgi:hypothetical protein
LAARVRELAETDVFAASLLAQRGIEFSPLESLLDLYYEDLKRLKQIQTGQNTMLDELMAEYPEMKGKFANEERKAVNNYLKLHANQLAQLALDAITARDSDKLFELAKAVKFLKSFKPQGDPMRARILTEKDIGKNAGPRWTVSQLAKLIGWPDSDQADGYPHLRRLCKELKFPLLPAGHLKKK